MISGVLGTVLVVIAWLSVLRTVFIPRPLSSRAAKWTVRVLAAISAAIARRLPSRVGGRILDFCAPMSLFTIAVVWLLGIVLGFTLIARSINVVTDMESLTRFVTFRLDGMAIVLEVITVLSIALMFAAFHTYLVGFTKAYSRRERQPLSLAPQVPRLADADTMVTLCLRANSHDAVNARFAEWTDWLDDVHWSHRCYPALVYSRPTSPLSWPSAAIIMLDTAALIEAIAPSSAPGQTRALLTLPTVQVSFHGREDRLFNDTVQLAIGCGLHEEHDRQETWSSFQGRRRQYAPYATAINYFLMYEIDQEVNP